MTRYNQFPCAIIRKQNVSEFLSEVCSEFYKGIQVFCVHLRCLHAIKSVSLKLHSCSLSVSKCLIPQKEEENIFLFSGLLKWALHYFHG